MSQPEKPFFCRSNMSDIDTECYATESEAISAAEQARMAPFTIHRLFSMPTGHRMTNGRAAFDEKMKEPATT